MDFTGILTALYSLTDVVKQLIAWLMGANPMALILVGAVIAVVGKRIAEAIGLFIVIYGAVKLVAAFLGYPLPF